MLKSAIATVLISDMDAACHFYGDVLGLAQKVRFGPAWAEYVTPDAFVIGLHPRRESSASRGAGGISIGFGVANIEAERACLEAAGVVFHGPTKTDGPVKLAFFSDPDENVLYLSEAASSSEQSHGSAGNTARY